MVSADAAVVACLSTRHRNQSSCQDQTEHLASGTDKIGRVTKFQKIYEPLLSSRCQKVTFSKFLTDDPQFCGVLRTSLLSDAVCSVRGN